MTLHELPPWAERTEAGRVRCTVCDAEADELPVDHVQGCIYNNDLVADGGRLQPEYEPLFDAEDRATFEQAVEQWGLEAQVDMATEEAGELIVALSRYMRGRNDLDDLVDELADVRIMYEQLAQYIDRERVEEHTRRKMDRLRERLAEDDA